MSRLRATLSTNPIDQEVARHVDEAQRAIRMALRKCEARTDNPVLRRRTMAVRRDLERVLDVMSGVRRVASPYDMDPDLTGEPPPPRPKRTEQKPAAPPTTDE